MSTPPRRPLPPILTDAAPLARQTEAWLCDIWGVVHNGLHAHPVAVAALAAYRAQGGTVVLITNAPRPAADVQRQLDQFGVAREAYDRIITSGDLTREWVRDAGVPLYHLGPAKDLGVFAGLDIQFTDPEAAKLVVCTGLRDDEHEGPEDYRAELEGYLARGVTMACANPDITVERGTRLLYCAGAIAALYQEIGGQVRYAGKPHPEIYVRALEIIKEVRGVAVPPSRVLGIGDSLRTDMAGAWANGMPALFIASAIHVKGTLDDAEVARLFGAGPDRPVAAMSVLKWG